MEFCFVLLNIFYYFLTTKGHTLPKDLASVWTYNNICSLGAQYYADPHDCNFFIHCSNGIPYRKKCAIPLYWNQNRLTCQWSSNHCSEQINTTTEPIHPTAVMSTTLKPTPTLEPIVANETTSEISNADISLSTSLPEVSTTGHNRPEPSTLTVSKVSTTTTGQTASPIEECEEGRVIASELCEYYYQCFDGKHRIIKCPQGSYWNQEVIACTIDNSGCLTTTTFITTSEVHLSTPTNNLNTEIAIKTTSEIAETIIDKSTDGISVTSESTTIIITADGETTSEGATSEDRTENNFTLASSSFNASKMNSNTFWTTIESKTSEITAGATTSSERSKSTQYTTTTIPQSTERSIIEAGETIDDGEISNATTASSAGSSTESRVQSDVNDSTGSGTTTNKTTKSDSSTEETNIETIANETTSEGTTSEDRTENSFTLALSSFNASTMNNNMLSTTTESNTSETTAGTTKSSETSTQYTAATVPQSTERSTIETGETSDDGEISNATTASSAGSSTESTVQSDVNESTESGTTTNKTTKSESSTEETNIETIANETTSNASFSETRDITASVPTSEAMISIASTETPITQITNDLSTNGTTQSTIVIVSNICQNTKTEYHADANNCTQFIECISGQAHIQSCPELYHWDAEQALCITGSCPQITILPEDSYTTEEITRTSSYKFTTLTPNICTSNLREYHTFPDNCTKFIECVNGIPYEVICPQYYYWDEEQVSCVFGVCLRNKTFS